MKLHCVSLQWACTCLLVFVTSLAQAHNHTHDYAHWQSMRIVNDTHGNWSAEHAWQQSLTEQAMHLTHPHEPVRANGVKTVWAAWSLPASVTQNLPVWLGIYLPSCVDVELWVRWNKGEWHLQSMEQHQRYADWGEGHLLPVWAIRDGTLREIDVLLKIENLGVTQLPVVLQKPETFIRQQWKFALPYTALLVFLLSVMMYALSLMRFFDALSLALFVFMLCLQLMVLGWLSGLVHFLFPALSRSHTALTGEAAVCLWVMLGTWHTRLSISMSHLPDFFKKALVYWTVGWGLLGLGLTFIHHSHEWPAYILLLHSVLMMTCCFCQSRRQGSFKNKCYAVAWGLYALAAGVYVFRHSLYLHPTQALLWVGCISVLASLLLVWASCWRWMLKLAMLRDKLKMALKRNRWVAVAQHDLWQPLQSMQLYANALAVAAPEHMPRLINGIQLAAINAVDCMRHLQDWYEVYLSGKALETSDQAISADAVLQPLFTECLAMAHAHCISLRYCRNRSVLNVNPAALQRILRNLIHNALTYTPAGGKVLLGCRRKHDRLWIYCMDNGQGMTDQQLRLCTRAHQRFGHVENLTGNHQGLGLYSVQKMAKQLGLKLYIESSPAKGSMFAISVPLARQQSTTAVLKLSHAI